MSIFFTSDTHYHHKNIVRGTSEWKIEESPYGIQRTRDFDTLEEHDEALIKRFNEVVKQDDVLWHLGDWSFGGYEQIQKFRNRLICQNIHIVFGNHDQNIVKYNLEGCFNSTQWVKQFTINKQMFFLSHYSHQVWDKSHKGSIHLFGHSHGSLKGIGRSMDCGVDTNNLYPYHLDEILSIMNKIDVKFVDHHNKKTN